MSTGKPIPHLEVHFPSDDIRPELITVRLLADTIAAVTSLGSVAGAGDAEEASTIRLVGVKRGSATFQCVADNPDLLLEHLKRRGKLLQSGEIADELGSSIEPLRRLSSIAASVKCPIVIRRPGGDTIAQIFPSTYETVSDALLIRDRKVITGNVQRVGGATDRRCVLRVAFQDRLLYCNLGSQELARTLGRFLYQDVVVSGEATLLRNSWRIIGFRVDDVVKSGSGPLRDAFAALRDAGGSAWDQIPDPESYLRAYSGR